MALRHDIPAAENGEPTLSPAAVDQLGAMPSVRASLEFFRQEKKWIDEQHLELCRVPAPTFREEQRANYLAGIFRGLGQPAHIDEAGNVMAPVIFDRKLPFIAVTAHMDTVLAPRRQSDVALRPDGTLEGPGVTDNGSGLAALLALARAFQTAPPLPNPRRNILIVANVAEEGEGNLIGMKHLCRHSSFASRISGYLVIDGASIEHITAEALGSRRFEITIEGRGGHSWNNFGRANPVHALGRAVALLADTPLPSEPRTTLSVGVVEGGCGVNSIAPWARAKVDIRSSSSNAMQQVVEAMEEAARTGIEAENRKSTDHFLSYRIREIGHRPAAAANGGNIMLECMQTVDAYMGIRSRRDCASTDANVPLSMGLPAVAIGAGGRGGDAHSPSEWFHPEGREVGLQRIMLALSLFLKFSG